MAVKIVRTGATQFSSPSSWVDGTAPADGDTAILTGDNSALLSFTQFANTALTIEFGTASADQNLDFATDTVFGSGIVFDHVAGNVNVANRVSGVDNATFNMLAPGGRVTFSALPGTTVYNGSSAFNVANGDTLQFGTLLSTSTSIIARQGTASFAINGGSLVDYAGHDDTKGARETVTLTHGGEFDSYTGSITSAPKVVFGDVGDIVTLHADGSGTGEFGNTVISGFANGDVLEVANFTAIGIANTASGQVTLIGKLGSSPLASTVTLTVTGQVAGSLGFQTQTTGAETDTFITTTGNFGAPPCFVRGTLIETAQGATAVERLAIGDTVVTAAGVVRPIKWIGFRSYAGRFLAGNPDILPVLIRAGALADGVPATDLMVSPKHALFVDGVLVPAIKLVDGVGIAQITAVESVEYWHVELDSHDILRANGAPAESFVDVDSRQMFENAAEYGALHPAARLTRPALCAPLVEHGDRLAAIRARLAARAGAAESMAAPGALAGHVEHADLWRIGGWAADSARPGVPVRLEVLDGEAVIATGYADHARADLAQAGLGACGFDITLPQRLSPFTPHDITVRRAEDGAALGEAWAMEPLVVAA